jgi:hypothetical protein
VPWIQSTDACVIGKKGKVAVALKKVKKEKIREK